MKLIKPAFTREKFEGMSEVDTGRIFTVRLNAEERVMLDKCKVILQEPKDSSAVKQLAGIGALVLQDTLTGAILAQFMSNLKDNKRLGLTVEPTNVTRKSGVP